MAHAPPPMAASKELPPAKPLQQPPPPQTPAAAAAARKPLPSPPLAPPQAVPEVAAPPFVFILPPDTSGTALTKLRSDEPLEPGGLPQPKTTGTTGKKRRRSRGSVLSGAST